MIDEHDVLTVDETATILHVSRRTVYTLIRDQRLPTVLIGRKRLVLRAAFEQWLVDQLAEQEDVGA